MGCESIWTKFISGEFIDWNENLECSINDLKEIIGNESDSRKYFLGKNSVVTYFTFVKTATYKEPVKIWHRDNMIVKIEVELPALKNDKEIINSLQDPDLQLDYYYDIMLEEKGEWVYYNRGIMLQLNKDRNKILRLAIFPSSTKQNYLNDLYLFEQPREFPFELD